VSRDGKGFVLEMHGGYKEREPFIEYHSFVDETRRGSITAGLEGLNHTCFDHERFLIVGGDDRRVKVWTMAPPGYKGHEDTIPLYTMKSKRFSGPIAFLPGNRIARAGKGELAVWNMSKLPTHGPSGQKIIGEKMSGESLGWGAEEDGVEMSSGTPPHSKQQLPWKEHTIGTWHSHPSHDTVMLCGTEQYQCDRYYCHAIDLEHGGKVSARYLGLGGSVTGFSTSQGDQNCFTVGASDGFVRLYDCRSLLPVLTLAVSPKDNEEFQPTAVLCHPEGIPRESFVHAL
jgi:WD40 repeat protein